MFLTALDCLIKKRMLSELNVRDIYF